jgi:glycosyltransferase involved in cell wall biosynthesis
VVHILLLLICVSLLNADVDDKVQQQVRVHMKNGERELAIIIPTYNNAREAVCVANISSVLDQDYEHFHVYLVDDCSSDATYALLETYLKDHPRREKVTLMRNEKQQGALYTFYTIIHSLADHVIVVNVDGDDQLAPKKDIFSRVNGFYEHKNIWLTYGQYEEYPSGKKGFCRGYPKDVIERNAYRTFELPISHLRTYYAWLFKRIHVEDLMFNGAFMQASYDKAIMVPMIEMSGGRFMCVQDILYIYNAINPRSHRRIRMRLQARMREYLLAQPSYKPLTYVITDFAIDA